MTTLQDEQQNETMSEAQKRLAKFAHKKKNKNFEQSAAYSLFVRRVRLLLPLVAIAIIAALMTWPAQEQNIAVLEEEQKQSLQNVRKNELESPRFESVDDENRPYTVTADKAIQAPEDENILLLSNPVADMLLNTGNWVAIKSDNGTYLQDAEKLTLEDNVRLFHDDGYEMVMKKLDINLKTRTASSNTSVAGQGPAGSIEATGLRGDNMLGVLAFTGPAKLILKDGGSLGGLASSGQNDG